MFQFSSPVAVSSSTAPMAGLPNAPVTSVTTNVVPLADPPTATRIGKAERFASCGVAGTTRRVALEEVERVPRSSLGAPRSEEHTSELQSQSNLVCRLLLEK